VKTIRLVVRGDVQGVGFRAFTVRAAQRHGARGWVRNLPDGSVEIAAQGAPPEFFDEIATGPRFANVRSVERTEVDEPAARGFDERW
jgi:acylphosphatase